MAEELHVNIRSADPRTRRPDLYSAPAQPAAEHEVAEFIAALVNLIKPQRVLELGTAFGHTSQRIGRALASNGFGTLDTLDVNEHRLRDARKRCKNLPVHIHRADYRKWTPPEGPAYDLAFFDCDRAQRDREFALYRPHLAPHAVVLFHDAGEQHTPTQEALARLPDGLPLVYLPCPRGLVISCVGA